MLPVSCYRDTVYQDSVLLLHSNCLHFVTWSLCFIHNMSAVYTTVTFCAVMFDTIPCGLKYVGILSVIRQIFKTEHWHLLVVCCENSYPWLKFGDVKGETERTIGTAQD